MHLEGVLGLLMLGSALWVVGATVYMKVARRASDRKAVLVGVAGAPIGIISLIALFLV